MRRHEREWARGVYRTFHPFAPRGGFDRWLAHVQGIEVELHPGGRATMVHPETQLRVELRWGTDPQYLVKSFRADAPPGKHLPWVEVSMSYYVAALGLALSTKGEPAVATDVEPPAQGKSPSLGFYRHFLSEWNELIREGESAPVRELAARYDRPEGTIKSWHHRSRKYLEEGS